MPEKAASVVVEYEDEDGWRYRVSVFPEAPDPNASPGRCVDVAPPGQTNLVFTLVLEGLAEDRESPIPQIVATSNIVNDGIVLVSVEPFSDEIREAGSLRVREEIAPNAPDTKCVSASGIYKAAGSIPAGGSSVHSLTIGPVNEDSVGDVIVGLRFFTEIGEWIEAHFTIEPDSGTVVP